MRGLSNNPLAVLLLRGVMTRKVLKHALHQRTKGIRKAGTVSVHLVAIVNWNIDRIGCRTQKWLRLSEQFYPKR